jgi:2-dehydro-3-deoxygluconokinase
VSHSIDILSIGEAMAELSTHGALESAKSFTLDYAGDTFNTAVAAARLGSQTGFLTCHGQDAFAEGLRDRLKSEGIVSVGGRATSNPTGLYFVSVDESGEGQFTYYRQNSAASKLSEADITAELIQNCKLVYSSGISLAISENCRKAVLKAFKTAREFGVTTAFDPNYRVKLWNSSETAQSCLKEIAPNIDFCFPSYPLDAHYFPQLIQSPEELVIGFQSLGIPNVLVKAASQGVYVGFDGAIKHYPAYAVDSVIDTTGAGDAFNGGFLHGLTQGKILETSIQLGLVTAALKTTQTGTASAMPYHQAVYQALELEGFR